nr:hypothetical protein [Tanacetum cinerariifolium]
MVTCPVGGQPLAGNTSEERVVVLPPWQIVRLPVAVRTGAVLMVTFFVTRPRGLRHRNAQHVARELAGAADVAQHQRYIVGRGAGLGAGGGKHKRTRYRAAHGARDGIGPHGAAHVGGRARIAAKSGVVPGAAIEQGAG